MKNLKFKSELCELILSGEKTATWRLFDDKDLQVGDEIQFVNKETGETIGDGEILKLKVTSLGSLQEEDWIGHEKYSSPEEMYKTYRGYYGDKVGPDTKLKIIDFSFQKLKKF
ncbi:ASCH domain-containing protein [Candidatus Kaiserbacteria bacterium]|nr:ASCH domain-containing protein [Candidatus Kaiserbacteria bacterium]